jgi:hypothetical protein
MDCFASLAMTVKRRSATTTVMPRAGGVSSTLRLVRSITAVSGILGHPPSRVTTSEYVSAFSRRSLRPRFAEIPFPQARGSRECRVHAAPAVSCARMRKYTHTSIQVQPEHSGIPCAMALRLMPRSPWRRIRLASIAAGLMAKSIGLDRSRHRQLGTSHGCRDHTVLPYASASYVLRDVEPLTGWPRPAATFRADALASTASRLAFVTIAIRPSCRDGTARK